MRQQTRSSAGFTLVEIMIVVAIIGLLATIAVPNYVRSRRSAQKNICISNLRQIDGAIQNWALEARKEAGQPVQYSDIRVHLHNSVICPAGGTSFDDSYQLSGVDAPPACLRVTAGEFAHQMPL